MVRNSDLIFLPSPLLSILCFIFTFSGCTVAPPLNDSSINSVIQDRTGQQVRWEMDGDVCESKKRLLAKMLAKPLTADEAIQIALLNNPQIQAFYEEVGIAWADLVEAGLFSNPLYEVEIRYPHQRKLKANIEYIITTGLLDLFLVPLRKSMAEAEYEQVKIKVSNQILDLAFEVREIFYELIGENQKLNFLESQVELESILRELAHRQSQVGNIYLLQEQQAQAQLLQRQISYDLSKNKMIHLKEKLNQLLGFTEDACLILPEGFDPVFLNPLDCLELEHLALDYRLDLQIAYAEIMRLQRLFPLKEGWTYLNWQGGVAGKRDADGTALFGPAFSGQIPIFNNGQAARLRLLSQLRQARDRLEALQIQVRAEVREAFNVWHTYFQVALNYQEQVIPLQNKILKSSEELYNVMGLGIDQLLENKREEIAVQQNYVENIKNLYLAEVRLDRALGGMLFKLSLRNLNKSDLCD